MRRVFCRVTLTNILILLLIFTLLFNLSILLQILSTLEVRNKEEAVVESEHVPWKNHVKKITEYKLPLMLKRGELN